VPATLVGKHDPKKRIVRWSYAARHAGLTAARTRFPGLSVRRLCALFSVYRTWYAAHASGHARHKHDAAVRAQMAEIRQRFPCYGYRRMSHALRRAGLLRHPSASPPPPTTGAAPAPSTPLHSAYHCGAACVLPLSEPAPWPDAAPAQRSVGRRSDLRAAPTTFSILRASWTRVRGAASAGHSRRCSTRA
jgi:hypothetical protein